MNNTAATYTVSRLNREIRTLLERGFSSLRLSGEISNFVGAASGHWYFSLKDDKAQVKAAMWRGNNRYCRYQPKNGDQVLIQGRVSLYEPRGDYQLIVEQMEPAGEGLLKQQFEALKMRLAAEGLFSSAYKQPLPQQINRVGVITSATGAAIKDILTVLKRRAPQLEVIIYPALVQGAEAHLQLIDKLRLANARNEVDVLIIGRGGGSLEDLWCFNEEALARAIFESRLPVISAVGHEIDTTISDYVADLRAPTPSAAAKLVSPDTEHLKQHIAEQVARLASHFRHHLARLQQRLAERHHGLLLRHPKNQLMQQSQRLDELTMRLQRAMERNINGQKQRLDRLTPRLHQHSPARGLLTARYRLQQLQEHLLSAQESQIERAQNRLAMLSARLESVSPLKVLGRGYSLTRNTEGEVLASVERVQKGDILITRLADGEIESRVEKTVRLS